MRGRCTCRNAGDICDYCDAQINRAQENAIFAAVEVDGRAADHEAEKVYGR